MESQTLNFRTFQGYTCNPIYQEKILSPAYDIISTEEARIAAKGIDMSYLHINKPQIDLPVEIDEYSDQVYAKGLILLIFLYICQGLENLQQFIKKNYLLKDTESRVYLYQAQYLNEFEGKTAIGVILLVSMADYERNLIRKHEKTRVKKEVDRTKILEKQQANIEPLFLFYENSERIDKLILKTIEKEAPIIDTIFLEENVVQIKTKVWKVPVDISNTLVDFFTQDIRTLYIADGHHRTAASFINYKNEKERALKLGNYTGEEAFNYAMALCYPKSDILILDYNRIVKTLCGKTKEEILKKLESNFAVKLLAQQSKPQKRGEIVMYIKNEWYLLHAKDQSYKFLDVDLIDKLCFQSIFGIEDIRTDERVEFVGGLRDQKELIKLADETDGCAFFMFPVTVNDVVTTVNKNEIMPCKSTWVEPIPRSGAVLRLIKEGQ